MAVIERRGRFSTAEPLFERGGRIALEPAARRAAGRIALIETGGRRARVVRELGSPQRAADVVEALLWERLGGRGFPERLEEAAATAAGRPAASVRRRDLRGLATFTVDPATARDFDDAVSAEREGDSIRLWIHIADVAAHVAPGSDLEREALDRGNSVYVPGRVEPMLPAALSSVACSLVPGEDRLAVTTEIELGADGRPRSASFYRSLVRSDVRLSYDQLDELFAGMTPAPAPVAEPLAIAREAAAALRERRAGTGLAVSSREPEFEFGDDGEVVAAHGVAQTEAHSLIEQLMVLNNEQVAQLLESRRLPTLYRVHEQPDPERIATLIEQLASLEVPTPGLPERLAPSEAAALAVEASRLALAEAERRGHGADAYTSLVLRAMKQAHYSDRNLGHAGLGSPAYLHFTSPIRRYPDLIAHRALLDAVGEDVQRPTREEARAAAVRCSEREREAARIERAADDICSAFLLERELFERGWDAGFAGEVSGVIGAGAFVAFGGELGDTYEGFLPARRLRGERFELNPEETALVGSKTGRRLRLGDPVSVNVSRVEAARGRVDLDPLDG